MKVGRLVFGGPRAGEFPTLLLDRRTTTFRRYSPLVSCSSIDTASLGHVSYIKEIAATQPPEHLPNLLKMLQVRGEPLVSPAAKRGMIPLAVPLSKNSSGYVTALLRWPTAPPGMEMPVVEVRKYGVWLLAKNIDQYIHRILVEEDVKNPSEKNDELFHASADAGIKLYNKGTFEKSGISSLDVYILQKIGLFPDILERKIRQHFDKGDHVAKFEHLREHKLMIFNMIRKSLPIHLTSYKELVSAMVTAEFYTKKDHFPGFGRPFVFNAEVLLKVGRSVEAKDAARGALKFPWWTLGCAYKEVAKIAEWEDEQIEYINEKVSEEGKQEDLKKGKEHAQVALDEAAFLLDLASVEGTWDEMVQRIAECYEEAGLNDISKFVLYRD